MVGYPIPLGMGRTEHIMSKSYSPSRPEHEVSIPSLSTSARFDHLAQAAEESAACAYWSHFGWEAGDGDTPPPEYLAFVAGRKTAAAVLRQKAEGLRRAGY